MEVSLEIALDIRWTLGVGRPAAGHQRMTVGERRKDVLFLHCECVDFRHTGRMMRLGGQQVTDIETDRLCLLQENFEEGSVVDGDESGSFRHRFRWSRLVTEGGTCLPESPET